MSDSWMEQEDVQSRITEAAAWDNEWVPVYESRNSYVEHFYGLLLPVSPLQSVNSMNDPSWGGDFGRTGGKIAEVRLRRTHFLGLRFRRCLELELATSGYFQNGTPITQRKIQDGDTLKSDTIFVRRDAVLNFLQETKQVLLWCIRSQRYSERELKEFGMERKSDRRRQQSYHYAFEQANVNQDQNAERPRMSTMTQVFGKCLVRLKNER